MTFRETWKESPDFRRSMRRLALVAIISGVFGWGMVRLEKKTHVPFPLAFCGAAVGASGYMGWDMRRIERERLALVKREHEMLKEIFDYTRQCEEEIRAVKRQVGGEEGKVWLQ